MTRDPRHAKSTGAGNEGPGADRLVLEVRNLCKHFPIRAGLFSRPVAQIRAVDGVSFSIGRGETLGLVGESGCGKSTVGRAILGLTKASGGEVYLNGRRIDDLDRRAMWGVRRDLQIIFQDPYSSLNPRMTVGDNVGEPLINYGVADRAERRRRVRELFEQVGLTSDAVQRYPHEFSGGQRQRIGIARAIALRPSLIVCDEAVSALDVSIQAQIINLLMDLQKELGLSYLFITHDLAVVEHISHRIAVMYLGKIVEIAGKRALFSNPQHPYTEALLSAVPRPDPDAANRRIILKGDVPSAALPPGGCRFHTRCPYAIDRCRTEEPPLRELVPGHYAACHLRDAASATMSASQTGVDAVAPEGRPLKQVASENGRG